MRNVVILKKPTTPSTTTDIVIVTSVAIKNMMTWSKNVDYDIKSKNAYVRSKHFKHNARFARPHVPWKNATAKRVRYKMHYDVNAKRKRNSKRSATNDDHE